MRIVIFFCCFLLKAEGAYRGVEVIYFLVNFYDRFFIILMLIFR